MCRLHKANKRNSVDNKFFEDGENVLLKYFGRKAGMGTVQQIRYNGPYSIQKYCGKGNYLLNDKCKTIENLKKWIEPDENNNENIHDRTSESDVVSVVAIHDMDVNSASVGHNVIKELHLMMID